MISPLPPALIFIIGGLLIPLFRGRIKCAYMLALPVLAYFDLLAIGADTEMTIRVLEWKLILVDLTPLGRLFAHIYVLITLIAVIYILHTKNDVEYVSGFVYAGSALGVVLAGDWITFFVFWELLTVGAIPLILARRTRESRAAAGRYLLVHVAGSLLLFLGILLHATDNTTLQLAPLKLGSPSSLLIFLGFGVNCAWPLLHAWLPDAYPEATIGGAVFLATFTTKTAVFALARIFPGEPVLMWIGGVMVIFPIFFAIIENDLRRVLSYSLINQVGFMVVGIGIGTGLSINGAGAHAYCHILYKALLFMAMGAVLQQTGRMKTTELGGLYKSMPFTCLCCIIGAASITAFPLFSGFVSKSMVMTAAADSGYVVVWIVLLLASAGGLHHAGIKIPFYVFFSYDAGIRVKEAPLNMRIAMGMAAFLCVFIGIFPDLTVYRLLPNPVDFEPYSAFHVTGQLQLLLYAALAFVMLTLAGLYPAEIRAVNVDADWLYRRGGPAAYRLLDRGLNGLNTVANRSVAVKLPHVMYNLLRHGPYRMLVWLMDRYWRLAGFDAGERHRRRRELYCRVRLGTIPIGITAFIAVTVLGLLFFA